MINNHMQQAATERIQAQQFCQKYADEASTYYSAAYQRELMVIQLLQELDVHKTNLNELQVGYNDATTKVNALNVELAEAIAAQANLGGR